MMYEFRFTGRMFGVNQRNVKSRTGLIVRSGPYASFIRNLVAAIHTQIRVRQPLEPPVHGIISFQSRHDVDGLIKPTLDACEEAGLLANDKHVDKITVERVSRKHPSWIYVKLWEAE